MLFSKKYPVDIYPLKVNNRNTRARFPIYKNQRQTLPGTIRNIKCKLLNNTDELFIL